MREKRLLTLAFLISLVYVASVINPVTGLTALLAAESYLILRVNDGLLK